tara:strand:- start:42 stop:281 length:240 start_codon:yes stop_codon:yes gene_type:complete
MELKETTNLPASVEINLQPPSERNESNNQRLYNLLFPGIEDPPDPIIDKDISQQYDEKLLFRSVSTLEWLNTWRPIEIS